MLIIGALVILLPFLLLFWTQYKTATPGLQWPAVAGPLKLEFADKPPRILGAWEGRHVLVEEHNAAVLITMQLTQPSRLRVEFGAKEDVIKRAGMLVPDPVQTGDSQFESRLLARCSDRAAGLAIFEPALRQNILSLPVVDALGAGDKIQWRLPLLKDSDTLEQVLQVMAAVASEMERFPANA